MRAAPYVTVLVGLFVACSQQILAIAPLRSPRPPAGICVLGEGAAEKTCYSPEQLTEQFSVGRLTVSDPVYKKEMSYEGFWLRDILALSRVRERRGVMVRFTTADGYQSDVPLAQVQADPSPLLAFGEVGRRGAFQPLQKGKQQITPAPWYLVWPDTLSQTGPKKAWPYQVTEIAVVDEALTYLTIAPSNAASRSTHAGFALFKAHCLRCHSINLQGGTLGPELNVPKNITEYRSSAFLRAFIRDASRYRARSVMPPFDLTKEEMNQLLAYLRWAKTAKAQ